jgi:hypothetical protein
MHRSIVKPSNPLSDAHIAQRRFDRWRATGTESTIGQRLRPANASVQRNWIKPS